MPVVHQIYRPHRLNYFNEGVLKAQLPRKFKRPFEMLPDYDILNFAAYVVVMPPL
jgi:hypothetical protein